jgi:hypothetical protein
MKQTAQKKPKVFRTLIRRIHISRKTVRDESNGPAAGERTKSRKPTRLSFSARNSALCENTGSFFNSSQRKEA